MDKVNLFALYIGLFVGAIFMTIAFFKKNIRPQLNHLVVVVLATTGSMVGIHLGYLILTLEDQYLGKLSDQRIPIALGALAVIWVSIETLANTFKLVLNARDKNISSEKLSNIQYSKGFKDATDGKPQIDNACEVYLSGYMDGIKQAANK